MIFLSILRSTPSSDSATAHYPSAKLYCWNLLGDMIPWSPSFFLRTIIDFPLHDEGNPMLGFCDRAPPVGQAICSLLFGNIHPWNQSSSEII